MPRPPGSGGSVGKRADAPVSARASQAQAGGASDIAVAVSAATVSTLPVFMVSALAIQLRDSLHLGTRSFSLVISIYFAGAAVSTIPLGTVTEALGGIRVMRFSCLLTGVLLVSCAVVGSWAELAPVMLLAGVSNAALQPAANQFLSRRVPSRRQGLAFGIKQASVPMATLLGGLAVPLIALTVGWRWAFLAAGGISLGVVALLPRPRLTLAQYRAARSRSGHQAGELLPLVVLAAGFGMGVAAATSLAGFLVTSCVAYGVAKGTAGLLVALGGAVACLGRVVAGLRADRRGGQHLPSVSLMLAVGSAGYLLLALSMSQRLLGLLIPAVLLAFAVGWGWNGLFNFAVVCSYRDHPARATAITQTGNRVGSVVGPLLFGLLVTRLSYAWAWLFAGLAAMSAAAVIMLGNRLLRR